MLSYVNLLRVRVIIFLFTKCLGLKFYLIISTLVRGVKILDSNSNIVIGGNTNIVGSGNVEIGLVNLIVFFNNL
jgi:hypothetical protein